MSRLAHDYTEAPDSPDVVPLDNPSRVHFRATRTPRNSGYHHQAAAAAYGLGEWHPDSDRCVIKSMSRHEIVNIQHSYKNITSFLHIPFFQIYFDQFKLRFFKPRGSGGIRGGSWATAPAHRLPRHKHMIFGKLAMLAEAAHAGGRVGRPGPSALRRVTRPHRRPTVISLFYRRMKK